MTNVTVADINGDPVVFKTTTNTGVETPHHNVDTLPGTAAPGAATPAVVHVVGAYNGTDIRPLQLDASNFLKVVLQAGTAAFGKLAANAGVVIGDVNSIAGQTGVDGGSGTVSGATQRVCLATNVALPAGTNILGKAGIDQTTPGTTNAIAISTLGTTAIAVNTGTVSDGVQRVCLATNVALPAGTALLGKTGIDQTTPGTTNAVALSTLGANAVSAGNGASGTGVLRVTIASDSTGQVALTSGSVVALAAGSAAIGTVTSVGAAASGAAKSGNPVLNAGQDGTNAVTLLVDSSGRQVAVGAAASGAAKAGNPVLMAGQDGTNAVTFLVNSSGQLKTQSEYAEDAAMVSGDIGVPPLFVRKDTRAVGASDGDYVHAQTDANGSLRTVSDYIFNVAVSKTRPNDTNTYAIGDVINESTSAGTVFTFAGLGLQNAGTGIITRVNVIGGANQTLKPVLELWLFDTTIVADNDNATFTPIVSELATLVAVVPLVQTFIGTITSGNCVYTSGDIAKPYKCAAADTSLYGVLVVRNAYVPIAQETFNVSISAIQE